MTIALDAMGGDLGPRAVIPGAARALSADPHLRFLLFGREADITSALASYPALRAVSQTLHTDQVVASDDKPATALRQGRESSMRKAIDAVADGRASCVVSSGNTGALMAMAKIVLKTLPGIHRPAIASVFPTMKNPAIMLDLGANIECDPEMLVQFAVLGAVYARAIRNVDQPTVGLLNVGSEDVKGHDELRRAAAILGAVDFPGIYHGFIEGNDIPLGTTDVVVTDGFTGNVALKVAEGVAKMTDGYVRQAFRSSFWAMLGGLLAAPALKNLKKRVDPRLYNGGMFLGINGICVKSHGGSDDVAFANAVGVAASLVRNNFNDHVAQEIDRVMNQESFVSPLVADAGA